MNIRSENIDHCRHLVGVAALTRAAAQFGMLAVVAVLCTSSAPGYAQDFSGQEQKADIGFLEIDKDITLRRMVVRNPRPKGTVLFLHGFPETLYAWKDIALVLAHDYEIHAFDWPGYGLSSRPTVDKNSPMRPKTTRAFWMSTSREHVSTHRRSRSTRRISERFQRFFWL